MGVLVTLLWGIMDLEMDIKLEKDKGVTLIELLIALVISAILIAGIYRAFIHQQRTYATQEQVADMQQNVRIAINKMMREIRMAGFGGVSNILSSPGPGDVNGFTNVITPNADSITILGGFRQISLLKNDAAGGQNTITLANSTSDFDGAIHHYISIGGLQSNIVQSRAGAVLTLADPLKVNYPARTPVFKIHAITYGIRDDKGTPVLFRDLYSNTTSSQRVTVAENIENVQFEYFDGANPPNQLVPPIAGVDLETIRMIRVTVTAKTDMADPDLKKVGDGYRRRTISSNIQIRNMGVNP